MSTTTGEQEGREEKRSSLKTIAYITAFVLALVALMDAIGLIVTKAPVFSCVITAHNLPWCAREEFDVLKCNDVLDCL